MKKRLLPLKGVQPDLSEMFIDELHATFIKNFTTGVNANGRTAGEGSNEAAFTPLQANATYANLVLPAGDNHCVGYYHSWKTREGYVWVHNSLNNHMLYCISATGTCNPVYTGPCLDLQLNPLYFIRDGRVEVKQTCYFDKVLDQMVTRTVILFTDFHGEVKHIVKEDSQLTDSFNETTYPALAGNGRLCKCGFITLALQPPLKCPTIETVALAAEDKDKQNLLTYKALQFRYRFIDVWGRWSEWSPISDQYIATIGGGCISEASDLPRCLKLGLSAGCPFIEKIEIAFRKCNGSIRGLATVSDWFLYDTIEKWDNTLKQYWWQRPINPDLNFDSATNTIYYTYCGDKQCTPIDVAQTNRINNPQPQTASTLFGLGSGIALGRNKRGFQPLDSKEVNKVTFTVEKPAADTCGVSKLVKIKVWGVIFNPFHNAPIPLRKTDGAIMFGAADCAKNNPTAYGQLLPQDQAGILGYLNDGKHYVISRQFRYDRVNGELTEAGLDYTNMISGDHMGVRYIPLQLWEFSVLPGTYRFRISAHSATAQDDFTRLSTYLIGQTSLANIGNLVGGEKKELIIDATQDIEIKTSPMMIYDLTRKGKGCAVGDASSVNAGYLYEDEKEGRPIELARVVPNESSAVYTGFTDHNGFYFSADRSRGLQTTLRGTKNCQTNQLLATSRKSLDNVAGWYKFDKLYVYKGETLYTATDRFSVKGRLTLCSDPNIGVSGAMVLLTRGGYAVTDAGGYFEILAHDIGNAIGTRTDNIIISQKGLCHLQTCNVGCEYTFPYVAIAAPACTGSARIVTIANQLVNIRGMNRKGATSGGRYFGGLVLHHPYGRVTYVQANEDHYMNIPSLTELKVFDACKLKWDFPADINFGPDVLQVSFFITENLNFEDSFSWVAERVQFVDGSGKTNTAAPTQIRLYYESLAEYNTQNGLATTTQWQFLSGENGRIGDKVEFIVNGDGVWFEKNIQALVKYDKQGKYVQIDYAEDLRGLKDGALIRLIRPKQCESAEFFYELCPMIDVGEDGKPALYSGYLNFYDRYFLPRQLPVPVEVKKTAKDDAGKEIETSVTENELRSYPYLFEHHSPSDFWGDHCRAKGRVNTRNPYEKQTCNRMEFHTSKSFSEDSAFNGLNYFDDNDVTNFDEEYGGIVLGFSFGTKVLVVCENDTFAVGYNDNRVRVNNQGEVEAISLPGRMGRPQKNDGERFGCDLWELNTIQPYSGTVLFIDRNNATLVQHDGSSGVDIAAKVGFVSYIKPKIKAVVASGGYFNSGLDLKTGDYLLTNQKIGAFSYVNQEQSIALAVPETMVYSIEGKKLNGWLSCTPEFFGALGSEVSDKQLFSFRQGGCWKHYHGANPPGYNTVYGVAVDRVLEVVMAVPQEVVWFNSIELDCKEHFFNAVRVLTSSGQASRLMKSWWLRVNKTTMGDFKCDLNTVADANLTKETGANVLLDGDLLYGKWIKVKLVGEAAYRDKYSELTGIEINYLADEVAKE